MNISTTIRLDATTGFTPAQWLGRGSVHAHALDVDPDETDVFASVSGSPDDLERLAAACIAAANLARANGAAA